MEHQDTNTAIELVKTLVAELEEYFNITFTDVSEEDSINYLRFVFYYSPGECLEISAPIGGEPCIIHNQDKNNRVPIGREDEFYQGFRERLFQFLIRIKKLHQF
ncbi:hypothetical protein ACXJY6_19015 [Vibrio sp. RC27]